MVSTKIRRRLGLQARGVALFPLILSCADDRVEAPAADPSDCVVADDSSDVCPPRGGQSGTEGGSEGVCENFTTRTPALDEVLEPLALSLNDLATNIGAPVARGRWLATDAVNQLSFELGPLVSAEETSARMDGFVCSWELDVHSVTVRSSDGGIDLQAPARIVPPDQLAPRDVTLEVELAALPEAYLGSAAWAPDVLLARRWQQTYNLAPKGSGAPRLVIRLGFDGPSVHMRAAASADGEIIGTWDTDETALPPGPPVPYTPDEPLASACSGAQQFQSTELEYTSFASASAALEGITGTWARCLDHAEADHVGLRILPDGSWQHVALEAGELVARSGFEHEGFIALHDTSGMNGAGGLFQVDVLPYGRRYGTPHTGFGDFAIWASERALVFGSSNEGWPAAVYQPTTLLVRTEPPLYADGERAGSAACAEGESGIMATAEATEATLTGQYVLCNGELGDGITSIHFGDSTLELRRADGTLIAAPSYEVSTFNAPRIAVLLETDGGLEQWSVVASRSPLKLWLLTGEQSAVFSAVP